MPDAIAVLTLIAAPERRDEVRARWLGQAPEARLSEAHSVADLLLRAAAGDVDLVLIDGDLAHPLEPLRRALRRSAPHATVLLFSDSPAALPAPAHGWDNLAALLAGWFDARAEGAAPA